MGSNLTLQEKEEQNIWDYFDDFLKVYKLIKNGEWVWYKNHKCKYVELRIDMRDGGCIIRDREGNRINPEDLEFQYPSEAPNAK